MRNHVQRGAQRLALVSLALGAAALAVHGCGGGGGGGGGASVDLGVQTGIRGTTSFQQNQPVSGPQGSDFSFESFPGQANQWDLNDDLSIEDGGNDQLDGALKVTVNGTGGASVTYGALVWSTPFLDSSAGVKAAGVTTSAYASFNGDFAVPQGTFTCVLAGLAGGVKLQQTIDLTGVTSSATLRFSAGVTGTASRFSGEPSSFAVILRTPSGASLTGDISGQGAGFPLTGTLTSQPVVISFEAKYTQMNNDNNDQNAVVDAVSVTHSAGVEVVVNGGFETGDLTGWTAVAGQHLQNVRASQTIGSVKLTRGFFARPDKLWGRSTDLFENLSGASLTVSADYSVDYGSDGAGIIYLTPNTSGEALSEWDGTGDEDRDAGVFIGSGATSVTFTSDNTLGAGNGNEIVTWTHTFTLAPSGKATLVHFLVLDGVVTGATATTITARATAIDAELLRIHRNLHTAEFGQGMTAEELSNIVND